MSDISYVDANVHDFGCGLVPATRHPNGGGWVADTATVDSGVFVGVGARVYGTAWVSGNAQVYGNAQVSGAAQVSGNAQVSGAAQVSGNARVTITAVVTSGLQWTVTISDRHIQIGCEIHCIDEWSSMTDSEIGSMHADALEFWRDNKTAILSLARRHQALAKLIEDSRRPAKEVSDE